MTTSTMTTRPARAPFSAQEHAELHAHVEKEHAFEELARDLARGPVSTLKRLARALDSAPIGHQSQFLRGPTTAPDGAATSAEFVEYWVDDAFSRLRLAAASALAFAERRVDTAHERSLQAREANYHLAARLLEEHYGLAEGQVIDAPDGRSMMISDVRLHADSEGRQLEGRLGEGLKRTDDEVGEDQADSRRVCLWVQGRFLLKSGKPGATRTMRTFALPVDGSGPGEDEDTAVAGAAASNEGAHDGR